MFVFRNWSSGIIAISYTYEFKYQWICIASESLVLVQPMHMCKLYICDIVVLMSLMANGLFLTTGLDLHDMSLQSHHFLA